MKNSNDNLSSLNFLPEIMQDLRTPLNTIFSFSELLKFEIERKKQIKTSNISVRNTSEFEDYADYAKEISDAVFEVNKIFENLVKKNLQSNLQSS